MDKETLRINAKNIRKNINIEKLSNIICNDIKGLEEFKKAKNVLLFYPLKYELNLLPLCKTECKSFYLPKVAGEKLLVCPYTCNTKLEQSVFKIYEPCSNPVSPQIIDFAIIPCLMADRKKFRLGWGKGFYDRFTKELSKNCTKISPVPADLIISELPVDLFDCPVDLIISEKEVF